MFTRCVFIILKIPTSPHLATRISGTACSAPTGTPWFSISLYFHVSSFVPSVKNVQICLANTPSSFKTRLRQTGMWGEDSPLLLSKARPPVLPFHSTPLLEWLLDHRSALPQEHVTTGPGVTPSLWVSHRENTPRNLPNEKWMKK